MNVTDAPAQIVAADAAIFTMAGDDGSIVIARLFDVAVGELAQASDVVITTFTTSPLTRLEVS